MGDAGTYAKRPRERSLRSHENVMKGVRIAEGITTSDPRTTYGDEIYDMTNVSPCVDSRQSTVTTMSDAKSNDIMVDGTSDGGGARSPMRSMRPINAASVYGAG